mgnify:CR=1 FL=1
MLFNSVEFIFAFLPLTLGLFWLALAIAPSDRAAWALENVLVAVFVPALVASMRWFPLSRLSWTLILLFLSLHTVGAHYTYAEVPYDEWSEALLGVRLDQLLGLQRNHFDRLVHFSYGLLMAYPMRELFLRIADARGFCLGKSASVSACPLEQPTYRDACEQRNDAEGRSGCG